MASSSSSENQKAAALFKPRLLKKDGSSPYEKCHFLLNVDFFVKEIANLI
jgi:hypothetical protein